MEQTPGNDLREKLTRQYAAGRSTLLSVIILTVVNLVMMLLDAGTYFLFSASVPYYLTAFGMVFDAYTLDGGYTVTALVISGVILVVYGLCWFFSGKKSGWLVAAVVLFLVDTLVLLLVAFGLLEEPTSCLLDLVFHVLVLFQMIRGTLAARKGKKLPAEMPELPAES